MCQAVWRSPLLPLLPSGGQDESASEMTIGSGRRFKRDLLSYLEAYGPKKTGRLVQQLRKHDFAAIRAALVASVPSKQLLDDLDSNKQTLWGWPALKDTLRRVPRKESLGSESHKPRPHIVAQVG
jgi:tyrosyl-DNA phosphodiesterase-1